MPDHETTAAVTVFYSECSISKTCHLVLHAGKPREAIDMYLHNQDWTAAMRVAERCEPGAVDDIYLAQVNFTGASQVVDHYLATGTLGAACASLPALSHHHVMASDLSVQSARITLRRTSSARSMHNMQRRWHLCLLSCWRTACSLPKQPCMCDL